MIRVLTVGAVLPSFMIMKSLKDFAHRQNSKRQKAEIDDQTAAKNGWTFKQEH